MPIPTEGWRSMDDAPRNGDIILVKFREFNQPNGKEQVAYAQWGCDAVGDVWCWRAPFRMGTTQHADGWMLYQDFVVAAQRPGPSKYKPEKDAAPFIPGKVVDEEEDEFANFVAPEPPMEFDL